MALDRYDMCGLRRMWRMITIARRMMIMGRGGVMIMGRHLTWLRRHLLCRRQLGDRLG